MSKPTDYLLKDALNGADDAIIALRRIVQNDDAKTADRVNAAKVLTDISMRMWEVWDLEERIRQLEECAGMNVRPRRKS